VKANEDTPIVAYQRQRKKIELMLMRRATASVFTAQHYYKRF